MNNLGNFITLAAGSYEGSLFGWDLAEILDEVEDHSLQFSFKFGFHVSPGSLKAIAISNCCKYLACGGMDEIIRVYNMRTQRSIGELSAHRGAITCLKFFNDTHLLSGSEDKSICIWRTSDWACLHVMEGHNDAILGISIHPSGKVALSVSKDQGIKMWNLTTGKCTYTLKVKSKDIFHVEWDLSGQFYMIVSNKNIDVFKASENDSICNIILGSRINKASFCVTSPKPTVEDAITICNRIVCICEDKSLQLYDTSGSKLASMNLMSNDVIGSDIGRLRDISCCYPSLLSNPNKKFMLESEGQVIVIVTSVGAVLVLSSSSIAKGDNFEESLIGKYLTRAEPRFTCVAAVSYNHDNHEKRVNDETKKDSNDKSFKKSKLIKDV